MRILHVIQRFFPARGGAETYSLDICRDLATEGHEVTVLTTNALDFEYFWNPDARKVPESAPSNIYNIRILRFPVKHLPLSGLAYPATRRVMSLLSFADFIPVSLLERLAFYTPWVPGLWQWLSQSNEQFDIVSGMTICFESLLLAGKQFAKERKIPYVIYPLTHLGVGDPKKDRVGRFYTMRHQVNLVCQSAAAVTMTDGEKAFYVREGMPEDKVIICGPGLNLTDIANGNGIAFREQHSITEPIVFYIGSMSHDKGVPTLVEAMRKLWQNGIHARLVLAGSFLAEIQPYWGSLPPEVRDKIILLKGISETEKRNLLSAGDVFVMASRTDSFGIVYLEAWSYKKPVIGAAAGGVPDVISDGIDGYLVPFGDTQTLSEKISFLLENPALAREMGEKGYAKLLQQHIWKQKFQKISRLYRDLTSG